ncbi:hypothetical protein DFH27DRAFT_613604 [Peziza echinospora]|nr:hypothetical protein DFH27DRAFT_613604 [Peziza echinospora]
MIQHEMQLHRPQGIRTLPPPHARAQRQSPPQSPLPHNGSCLVILPYSRSAFRGTYFNAPDQEVNTCECTSFFMSPGDPEACLCGHPARYHGPGPRQPTEGDLDAESSDSRPRSRAEDILAAGGPGTYLPPVPLFPQPYSARRKSSPLSAFAPESNQSPRASTGVSSPVYHYHHIPQQQQLQQAHQQCPAQITAILARLSTLETQLTSTTHELNHLSATQRHLTHAYNRLSTHTNNLSQELELIITKRGESARESLDLEVLVQRQKKMADDVDKINQALEALDERTEDLEFHSEDFERWMTEVNGRSSTGGVRGIKTEDDGETRDNIRRRDDGNSHNHYTIKSVHVKIEDSQQQQQNERPRTKPTLSLITSSSPSAAPMSSLNGNKSTSLTSTAMTQQQQQQQQQQQVTVIAPSTPPMVIHSTNSTNSTPSSSCKRRRSDSGVSQQQIPCLPSPPLSHGDIQLCVNKRSRTSQVLSA